VVINLFFISDSSGLESEKLNNGNSFDISGQGNNI
jgi:hypothetical protein